MNWLTLTIGEVAALSSAAAALALWLYLRQPRAVRMRVSTLRFWSNTPSVAPNNRRLKLREPWPFLAQLLFLIALIAALGNPRRGAATPAGRSAVLILDSSAWSQMQPISGPSWLELIRRDALDFVGRLPSGDRILLLRADSAGAPILPFTSDRAELARAITNLQSSSVVPDVPHALDQGLAALGPSARGLLVYIGPGFMDEKQIQQLDRFRQTLYDSSSGKSGTQFRAHLLGGSAPLQNRGVTKLALKRSEDRPNEWSLLTELKNYGELPADVTLSLSVNGQVFRRERVSLSGEQTTPVSDRFVSPQGGRLQAEIEPGDELKADDRAGIQLPSSEPVSVGVLTGRDAFINRLRAVLSANPYVQADFLVPGAHPDEDVMIYDGQPPANAPPANYIAFVPPARDASTNRVRVANWNADHPVTRWIRSRDLTVRRSGPLELHKGDVVLASSAGNPPEPLIIARQANGYRSVLVGFDPIDSNFTMEPAFPLFMAASIEWMTRPVYEQAEGITVGPVDLPAPITSVIAPSGQPVPFAGSDYDVHFFASESGEYRVDTPQGSATFVANVPSLPTARWKPTAEETASIESEPSPPVQYDLWRWLAALALIALWLEWRLFYFSLTRKLGHTDSNKSATGPRSSGGLHDLAADDVESSRRFLVRNRVSQRGYES